MHHQPKAAPAPRNNCHGLHRSGDGSSGTGAIGQQHSHHAAGRRIRGAGNLRALSLVLSGASTVMRTAGWGFIAASAGSGRCCSQRQQGQQPQRIGRPQRVRFRRPKPGRPALLLPAWLPHLPARCFPAHRDKRLPFSCSADQQAAFRRAGGISVIAFENQIGVIDGRAFETPPPKNYTPTRLVMMFSGPTKTWVRSSIN